MTIWSNPHTIPDRRHRRVLSHFTALSRSPVPNMAINTITRVM